MLHVIKSWSQDALHWPANSSSASSASTSSSSGFTRVSSFSRVFSMVCMHTQCQVSDLDLGFSKDQHAQVLRGNTRGIFLGGSRPNSAALLSSFLLRSLAAFFSFCGNCEGVKEASIQSSWWISALAPLGLNLSYCELCCFATVDIWPLSLLAHLFHNLELGVDVWSRLLVFDIACKLSNRRLLQRCPSFLVRRFLYCHMELLRTCSYAERVTTWSRMGFQKEDHWRASKVSKEVATRYAVLTRANASRQSKWLQWSKPLHRTSQHSSTLPFPVGRSAGTLISISDQLISCFTNCNLASQLHGYASSVILATSRRAFAHNKARGLKHHRQQYKFEQDYGEQVLEHQVYCCGRQMQCLWGPKRCRWEVLEYLAAPSLESDFKLCQNLWAKCIPTQPLSKESAKEIQEHSWVQWIRLKSKRGRPRGWITESLGPRTTNLRQCWWKRRGNTSLQRGKGYKLRKRPK